MNSSLLDKPQIIKDIDLEFNINLREVDPYSLSASTKTFTKNETGEITGLNLSWFPSPTSYNVDDKVSKQITNLHLIGKLHRLQRLYLDSNPIADLSPLNNLANLKHLSLRNTNIKEISAIKNLARLETLDIRDTLVEEIHLSGLRNLRVLNIENTNPVSIDLKNLENLDNLTCNIEEGNNISLIKLQGLKKLKKIDLRYINSIIHLVELSNLESLNLGYDDELKEDVKKPNQDSHLIISNLLGLKYLKIQFINFNKIELQQVGVETLNLNSLNAKSLSIKELPHLTNLNLSKNPLTDTELYLTGLNNLRNLNISHTQVRDLSCLNYLDKGESSKLTNLDISYTDIDKGYADNLLKFSNLTTLRVNDTKITDVNLYQKLKHLKFLDISNTKIKNLFLSDMSTLIEIKFSKERIRKVKLKNINRIKALDFSSTNYESVIIEELSGLEKLDLSKTKIEKLDMKDIKQLKHLNIGHTSISKKVKLLTKFTELQELQMNNTNIRDISFLSEFSKLKVLNINKTKVRNLSVINKLNDLEQLDANEIDIDKINIENLKNLSHISIRESSINNVSIRNIPKLNTLNLSQNKINIINLYNLQKLSYLDISDNHIRTLMNVDVSTLTYLNMSQNPIDSIKDISKLEKITHLNLSKTNISDIVTLTKLQNLTHVYLDDTKITNIEPIFSSKKLIHINIPSDTVFKALLFIYEKQPENLFDISINGEKAKNYIPPELFENEQQDAVITYLKTQATDTKPLNEVRIIIVGDGGSGKTSLVRRLMGQDFNSNESQTHGIRVCRHNITYEDNIEVGIHFWDFGGQEINHATHQFFYSKRNLYLLVVDARQRSECEYWLKYIESFGGASPVLIVINKIDENPSFDLNPRSLVRKFGKNINENSFFRVSCQTKEGIESFYETLKDVIFNMKLRSMPVSSTWFAVKDALTNMAEYHISYERYYEICRDNNVVELKDQNVLRELIHDLGLALDFQRLRQYDKQVLNPKWITKGVYRIINSPLIREQKGILHFDDIDAILHDWQRYNTKEDKDYKYPQNTHMYLIGVMQEFELCYELGNRQYIIPDLLPVREPNNLDFDDYTSHFVIHYEGLLPRIIMPRFMVRMHHRIPPGKKNRWRTGVVIEDPLFKASAVVTIDYIDRKVHIWSRGRESRLLLSFIRSEFEAIRSDFKKLEVSEWLYLYEDDVKIKYTTLLVLEEEGEETFLHPESRQKFNIKNLLDGIEDPEYREDKPDLKAFISYSGSDEDRYLKNKFKSSLVPLSYSGKITFWDKDDIYAGDEIEKQIEKQMDNSHIIFIMVSPDLLSSESFWNKKYKKIIEKHENNEAILVPIIIRPCLLESVEFVKIEALPSNKEPVTKWKNRDDAWLNVARGIENLLNSDKVEKIREML